MKMRFEAYKYTGNKPRIFETWVNAENISLHQNKKNNYQSFIFPMTKSIFIKLVGTIRDKSKNIFINHYVKHKHLLVNIITQLLILYLSLTVSKNYT